MAKVTQAYVAGSYAPIITLEESDLFDLTTILEFYISSEAAVTRHAVPSVTRQFARKLRKQLM